MTPIVLRHLPAVAAIEKQLRLKARSLLAHEGAEELPHLIDDASRELFGITWNDTLYPALPEAVRGNFGRIQWEAHFEILDRYTRDPNEHWRAFYLDLCCEEGQGLHCLEVFGRQLVCAIHGLHPRAMLAFADVRTAWAA